MLFVNIVILENKNASRKISKNKENYKGHGRALWSGIAEPDFCVTYEGVLITLSAPKRPNRRRMSLKVVLSFLFAIPTDSVENLISS